MEFHAQSLVLFSALAVILLSSPSLSVKVQSSGTHLLAVAVKPESSLHFTRSQRHRRQVEDGSPAAAIEVRQFHVSSKLFSRFATVTMESQVSNPGDGGGSREIAFQVQLPQTAFMSNFSMVVDGQVYVAKVMEKEAAQKRFDEAKAKNQTAGQVRQDQVTPVRGMELFTINVNLAPRGNASFTLVYNELLERRRGTYRQRLVVQPGSIVEDFVVRASFSESQEFKYFAYTLPGSKVTLSTSVAANETEVTATPDSRELVFRPSVEMQRSFDAKKGIQGEFTLLYSVTDDPQGSRVIVQNDYFAHFFAPPGLAPIPKNILFIIDISGSMSGGKIEQAREAMAKILDDLKSHESDTFNILLFETAVEKWAESPKSTLSSEIENAKGFLESNLEASGGTNIYQALTDGLNLLFSDERQTQRCDVADIIVFLTDGDPTEGVTDIVKIIQDVTAANKGRASLFSLGFGFNMNFDFLQKISDMNRGFARRIYAEQDAAEQLEDFYEEISVPVLCDVVARYSVDTVETELLTVTSFPLHFDGREIVVAGKLKDPNVQISLLGPELTAVGASGPVDYVVPVSKIEVLNQLPDIEEDLTEKLWAYMKIKSLLKQSETLTLEADKVATRQQALNMSLTYGFVTPLTSFSIVVEDTTDKRMSDVTRGFGQGMSFNTHAQGTGGVGGLTGSHWLLLLALCVILSSAEAISI